VKSEDIEAKYARIQQLQRLAKSISTTNPSNKPFAPSAKIERMLSDAGFSANCATCSWQSTASPVETSEHSDIEHELEWLVLGKATAQIYGHVLHTLLDQTLSLNDHIWYWDDILGSRRYASLYSLQTSPLRVWAWSKEIWNRKDIVALDTRPRGWNAFYALVDKGRRERILSNMHWNLLSPIARVRAEAQKKQEHLKQTRELNANALGVLLGEGLSNVSLHADTSSGTDISASEHLRRDWKTFVAKSIALMDAVLTEAMEPELDIDTFEDRIGSATSSDPYFKPLKSISKSQPVELRTLDVSDRLIGILVHKLPKFNQTYNARLVDNGKPSPVIRYWLPVTALVISSSTILRILVNRRADILTWIRESGTTVIDFWRNWVIDPIKKVIGTIRHDEASEVAIISKRSLEGDRESLERMVVDFAIQNPESGRLDEAEIEDIRHKVREGDLTPVLKAYEKDLQRPLMGALTGNLIRALLIQIQKTKVDVEIAIGGIDSLLKSQELVFGFVGLTPGLLVTVAVVRWLNDASGSRKWRKAGKKQDQMLGVLR
jgi:nuclear-control-of-ATPase protein 2